MTSAGMTRRDKRGRKIGYNWWRELNCGLLLDAELAWQAQAEPITMGYETEEAEYKEQHPRPTLKHFLVSNAGMHMDPNA